MFHERASFGEFFWGSITQSKMEKCLVIMYLPNHSQLLCFFNRAVAEAARSLIQGRAPGFRNTPPARFDATPVGGR